MVEPSQRTLCISSKLLYAKAAASAHLDVIMGVPIRIENDDSVSSGQVDAQSTSPGGQEEAELLGSRSIKAIDGLLPKGARDATINALILVPFVV